jgi:hypothetical protein
MKALMATLKNESVIEVTCWELKFHLFKALVLQTFTNGIEIWGGNFSSKIFEKGMKIHMMSHIKMRSFITYYIMLTEFGEPPMDVYAHKLTTSFQEQFAHLPSPWLVMWEHTNTKSSGLGIFSA